MAKKKWGRCPCEHGKPETCRIHGTPEGLAREKKRTDRYLMELITKDLPR